MGGGISVINMTGTSSDKCKCKCGSWISHWKENTSGEIVKICCVKGCHKEALVGAHVRIVWKVPLIDLGVPKPGTYILPFCSSHNNMRNGKIFEIDRYVQPVVAHECRHKRRLKSP